MNKKILLVSNAFYPINSPRSFRTTELVKEFAKLGHKVTLLTQKKSKYHKRFEKEYGIKILDLNINNYPVFDLSKGTKNVLFIKRVINRILQILFEYPDIELFFKIKKSIKHLKDFDLLISVAYPHPVHWGVARAWNSKMPIAKVWVADCGDPFMGATLDSFKKMFYFKYIEKWWCKKADFISVPFKGAIDAYYKEFHHKIKVIPQGFKFQEIEKYTQSYKPNRIPTFAYAGGFIPNNRDPGEFIEYLLSIKKDFKFIVFTHNKNLVTPYLKKANGKIEIKDYIPRLELLSILSTMDFVLNINNNISTQLPSKLIDYYLTRRPILSIDSIGFNKNTVDQFLKGNYTNQFRIENVDQYRIENVCNDFLNLIP